MLGILFGLLWATATAQYVYQGFTAANLACGTSSGALNVGLSKPSSVSTFKIKQVAFAIYGTHTLPANIEIQASPSTSRLSTSNAQLCCAPNCDLAMAVGGSWYNGNCGVNSCGGSSTQNKWYYMDFSGQSVGTVEQTGISQILFYDGGGSQTVGEMINIASGGSAFFYSYDGVYPTPTSSYYSVSTRTSTASSSASSLATSTSSSSASSSSTSSATSSATSSFSQTSSSTMSASTGSDAANSDSLALILGAVGAGLSALIGSILGVKWLRERNSVVPTNASALAKSPAIKSAVSFMGEVKKKVVKVQEFVDRLPISDSVKNIVKDPTKLLSKSAQDKIHAVEAMVRSPATQEAPSVTEEKTEIPISMEDLQKQMDTLQQYMEAHKNTK